MTTAFFRNFAKLDGFAIFRDKITKTIETENAPSSKVRSNLEDWHISHLTVSSVSQYYLFNYVIFV